MTKKIEEMTGVCRFCFQLRIVRGAADMTEEQITETATLQCDCEAAKRYRLLVQRAENAKEHVDKLFGDASGNFAQHDEIMDFMKHGIDVINKGHMKKLTINMNKGLKCTIERTTDEKIKVSREVKSVVEFKE